MTDETPRPTSDVAFTESVKGIQTRKGSRRGYAAMDARGGWRIEITDDLAGFMAAQRSVYLATVNAQGQPYIQHRGGPPGFLHVLDTRTIAFADFTGNRQYITQGNLEDNAKAHLFLMDYENQRRAKLWGTARIVEGDAELTARLMPEGYAAHAEQVLVFTVTAWDLNCPQHIPQRFEAEDVAATLRTLQERIVALEAELLRARDGPTT